MARSLKSNTVDDSSFELPKLRTTLIIEADAQYLRHEDPISEFFGIQFCPYQPMNQPAVFAAVSKRHIVVCKLHKEEENPCEVISMIRDDDEDAINCCCTWALDAEGRPLICVAGRDAKIKVFDLLSQEIVACFAGHGGEINDLATLPTNPSVLVSASDDTTVRLWSLEPVHEKQPCLVIFGGEGHSAGLLSVSFHQTGRYLLSAGHDQVINLWTIPCLPTEPVVQPHEIIYPHFSTSEVHSALVDCVSFYGDAILSRACHDETIVLWVIEGFSSTMPPPSPYSAPTNHDPSRLTRSSFARPSTRVLWKRLMQFDTPGCGVQFFMRFRLFDVPDQHPVLAFTSANGKLYFWDLARYTTYTEYMRERSRHFLEHQDSLLDRVPKAVRRQFLIHQNIRKKPMSDMSDPTLSVGDDASDGAHGERTSTEDVSNKRSEPTARSPGDRISVQNLVEKEQDQDGVQSSFHVSDRETITLPTRTASGLDASSRDPIVYKTTEHHQPISAAESILSHHNTLRSSRSASKTTPSPSPFPLSRRDSATPSFHPFISTFPPRPSWLVPIYHRNRQDASGHVKDLSDKESQAAATLASLDPLRVASLVTEFNPETVVSWEGKYHVSEPQNTLKAHRVESAGSLSFVGRQVGWSPDGCWCVAVGSSNTVVICQRWRS